MTSAAVEPARALEVTLHLQRTPESVLRLIVLLHRHRWQVEHLTVEPSEAPGVQRICLRVAADGQLQERIVSALHQLVDVIDVKVLDNAA
jgi:acetolactate synthase small subunit